MSIKDLFKMGKKKENTMGIEDRIDELTARMEAEVRQREHEISDDDVSTVLKLCKEERDKGNYDLTISKLEELTTLRPMSSEVWHELGCARYWKAYHAKDQNTKKEIGNDAILAYQMAYHLNPKSVWSIHDIGNSLMHFFNDPKQAEQLYRKCTNIAPKESEWFYHDLGLSLMRQERFEEAIEQYKYAMTINDKAEWTHNDIAFCYARTGKVEEMEKHRSKGIKLGLNKKRLTKDLMSSLIHYQRSNENDESTKDNQIKALEGVVKLFKEIDDGDNEHYVYHNCGCAHLRLSWLKGNDEQHARNAVLMYKSSIAAKPDHYWSHQDMVSAFRILSDEENANKYQQKADKLK